MVIVALRRPSDNALGDEEASVRPVFGGSDHQVGVGGSAVELEPLDVGYRDRALLGIVHPLRRRETRRLAVDAAG
ncbi:MAG: hypothetical protein WKF82_00140 [Nocardioidaceae bacterium]